MEPYHCRVRGDLEERIMRKKNERKFWVKELQEEEGGGDNDGGNEEEGGERQRV